jgi:hypothetical protein
MMAAAALACGGCANERPETFFYYQAGSHASSPTPTAGAGIKSHHAAKKTMGAKVLTAIALERVTGRRPDPARLAELH